MLETKPVSMRIITLLHALGLTPDNINGVEAEVLRLILASHLSLESGYRIRFVENYNRGKRAEEVKVRYSDGRVVRYAFYEVVKDEYAAALPNGGPHAEG
jgi:hypothetical protein